MPESGRIVVDTGPILALIAGVGSLDFLSRLYEEVIVPAEVVAEVLAGGPCGFGVSEFSQASFLEKREQPVSIEPYLANMLNGGEAAVIRTALDEGGMTVCIDEAKGRHVARLHGLGVTGSLGVVFKAQRSGVIADIDIRKVIDRMRQRGVWLSRKTELAALKLSSEM